MFVLEDPIKQRTTLVYKRSKTKCRVYSTFVSDLFYTRVVLCVIGSSARTSCLSCNTLHSSQPFYNVRPDDPIKQRTTLVYKRSETNVEYTKIDRMFFLDEPIKQRTILIFVSDLVFNRAVFCVIGSSARTSCLSRYALHFILDLLYTRVVLCLIGEYTKIDRMFVQTIRLNREQLLYKKGLRRM
jgi:hypothetical protein